MYYQGDGVPVSIEQAQKWFMRAAEQGNAYAQYNLGWLMQKVKSKMLLLMRHATILSWPAKGA